MSYVNFEELLVDSSRVLADLVVERISEGPYLKYELIPMLEEVIRIDSPGMKHRANIFLADIIKKFGTIKDQ